MAYINDKNLPYLVEKLSNADNIKINNNKHGSRVSTVINSLVTKSDNITKAIEQEIINNSHSFRVGTGDVNVSADVQDGFGEIGIKGVTYQNVFNDFSIGGEASKYVTTNGNKIKWTKPAATTSNVNIKYHNSLAQLNKTYTLVFYVYKNTLKIEGAGNSYNVAKFNITSYDAGVYLMPVNKTGLVQVKLTQPTTTRSDGKPYLEVYKETVGELEISYPVLLEGDHTNNPNLLLNYFDGIVGVGDKSKNLFDGEFEIGSIDWKTGAPNIYDGEIRTKNFIPVKPNKYYILNVFENSYENHNIHFYDINKQWLGNPIHNRNLSSINFVTPRNCYYIKFRLTTPNFKTKVQLEEGSVTTPYEPYYEGHKIEILSSGHNFLDLLSLNCIIKRHVTKHELTSNSISFSVGTENSDPWASIMFDGFKFKENATYRIKAKCKTTDNTNAPFISLRRKDDYNNSVMDMRFTNGILNTTFLANNVGDRVEFFAGVNKGNRGGCRVEFWDVCITEELSNEDLPFQPYLKDTNSITIDSPLMRLPNGVCDEITRDGELIRRVGKIVCTGEESGWNYWPQFDSTDYISFHVDVNRAFGLPKYPNKAFINTEVILSDKFLHENVASANTISEGIMIRNASPNYVGIRIKKNRLTNYSDNDTADVKISKLRTWLNTNNFTLYYQLLVPEVTQLNPISVRTFKDGQITFNTLVIPESTHKVQLNKSAQIESTNKEVNRLENRVTNLESFYDDVILETSYKLALLDYDFEYTKEREDE